MEDAEGQVVEQLVGQHHDGPVERRQLAQAHDDRADAELRGAFDAVGVDPGRAQAVRGRGQVEGPPVLDPQGGGALDEHVAQGRRAGRRGQQDGPGERARPGAGLDHDERVGPAQLVPPAVEGPGDDRAEQRPDLGAGQEVAPAAGPAARRVEAVLRVRTAPARSTSSNGSGPKRPTRLATSSSSGFTQAAGGSADRSATASEVGGDVAEVADQAGEEAEHEGGDQR